MDSSQTSRCYQNFNSILNFFFNSLCCSAIRNLCDVTADVDSSYLTMALNERIQRADILLNSDYTGIITAS